MRLRDFFRGPSTNNERKLTLSSSNSLPLTPTSTDVKQFLHAAHDNDTQTLQKYLLAGLPVDQADPSGQSRALHIAAEAGHFAACQLLLHANAQVNVSNASQSSPLHLAAYAGHDEIVQLLLSHGADVYQQDHTGRTPFHWAVTSGNLRLVEHFLALKDADSNLINIPDRHHWTPLMCACASNQASICALLLLHQPDLTVRNDRGMTVFHLIAFLGSSVVLRDILSSMDDEQMIHLLVNQVDQHNQTALFYACSEGHLELALTLIHAGVNPYHLDDDQQTCLHAMLNSSIILKRHLYLFYRLIQLVDFRSCQDRLGRTLLDSAIVNRYQTLIRLLTLLNYRTNLQTNSERRPLLSLRQISILKFKQSIIYSSQRPECQEELLRLAFEQTFHLQNRFASDDRHFTEKIPDDLSTSPSTAQQQLQQQQQQMSKYQKNTKTIKQLDKKLRKTTTISHSFGASEKGPSQIDLSRSKSQRELPVLSPRRFLHPMTNLVRKVLENEAKLAEWIDFPSLNGNPLLEKDLQWSIENYQLLGQ